MPHMIDQVQIVLHRRWRLTLSEGWGRVFYRCNVNDGFGVDRPGPLIQRRYLVILLIWLLNLLLRIVSVAWWRWCDRTPWSVRFVVGGMEIFAFWCDWWSHVTMCHVGTHCLLWGIVHLSIVNCFLVIRFTRRRGWEGVVVSGDRGLLGKELLKATRCARHCWSRVLSWQCLRWLVDLVG